MNTPEKRDNRRALRPKQIREIYGIPQSSLHFYCEKLMPESDRLPSIKLPGRKGKKGCRLVWAADMEAWLQKFHKAA